MLAQAVEVLVAIDGLNVAEQPLEGIVVGRRDLDRGRRRSAATRRRAKARSAEARSAKARTAAIAQHWGGRRATRVGRLLLPPLPHPPQEPADDQHQADLQDQ